MKLILHQASELSGWPTLDRWSNLRDDLNSLFDLPVWANPNRQSQLFTGWAPVLDLYQTNDNVVALVELSGMRKEDIEISLHDGTLTVAGEGKTSASDGEKAERTERYVGSFRRSIALPAAVDTNKVSANYRDGLLTITLPKVDHVKPRKITVS